MVGNKYDAVAEQQGMLKAVGIPAFNEDRTLAKIIVPYVISERTDALNSGIGRRNL